MDTVLSFLISAGIIAFGVWVVAGTITAGWPWTLMGLLAVIVGLLSLYGSGRFGTPRHGVFEGAQCQGSGHVLPPVCTENLIRVDEAMESPKLAE